MTSTQVNSLKTAIRARFPGKVEAQRVGPGRYRFTTVSAKFNKMTHLQRQDALWDIVDASLPREASTDISIILAYAPKDLAATT